jgi:hypothetical protein
MKYLTLILLPLLFSGCADSNEEFGKKVEHHMSEIAKNKDARLEAEKLCRPLSETRRSEEPRCVALQSEARGKLYKVPPPSDRTQDKGF